MIVKNPLLSLLAILILSFIFYLIIVHWFPMDFIIYSLSDNYYSPSDIGDTIGGIISPLVAIIAALFTYMAFYVQYEANMKQRNDIAIERFESKFYKLLEFHNSYSTDIQLGNKLKGKRVFIAMYNELRLLNYIVDNHLHNVYSERQIYEITYQLFFFGTGSNHRILLRDLNNKLIEQSLLDSIENFKLNSRSDPNGNRNTGINRNRITVTNPFKNPTTLARIPTYTYFDGHLVRLSHYYRNLFQIVKLVDEAKCFDTKDEYNQKYHYLSILRAQLSVYEQALLYFNACSVMGEDWGLYKGDNRCLLIKYCLIRSMPISFTNFFSTPLDSIRVGSVSDIRYNVKGKPLFEWEQIRQRLNEIL